MHVITLVGDPNDGTHGLFMNGVLICDSGDDDATLADLRLDFWRDAIDALVTALGGELVEETRYRPGRKVGSYDLEPDEWESFWPEKLEDMGPVEPPYDPDVELLAEQRDVDLPSELF